MSPICGGIIIRGNITILRQHHYPAVRRCPTAQIHADLQPADIEAHHKDSIIRLAFSHPYLSPASLQRLKAVCISPQGIVLGKFRAIPWGIKGHRPTPRGLKGRYNPCPIFLFCPSIGQNIPKIQPQYRITPK